MICMEKYPKLMSGNYIDMREYITAEQQKVTSIWTWIYFQMV